MPTEPFSTPTFHCPDRDITEIFAFRSQVFKRHCRLDSNGWVVTEFLPEVPWAGPRNTISCAAHLHVLEGRWLTKPEVIDDYTRFWLGGPGQLRSYSNALITALYERALVTDSWELPLALLPAAAAHWRQWRSDQMHVSGLLWSHDDRDGGEFSISGPGLRPVLNTYLVSDARAIVKLAQRAGDAALAKEFGAAADALEEQVRARLWDPQDRFYKTLPLGPVGHREYQHPLGTIPPGLRDQPAGDWNEARPEPARSVRELWGYFPWAYDCAGGGRTDAWSQLTNSQGFAGRWGPRSAERRHPRSDEAHPHECLWNGPSWPFATVQMLRGLAKVLHADEAAPVTRQDYLHWLRVYAQSQHRTLEDGTHIPWIDENLDPDSGIWQAREKLQVAGRPDRDRGVDYNHSTFCDLVITGLCGLVPRDDAWIEIDPLLPEDAWAHFSLSGVQYHGHTLDIRWQRGGGGLEVFCDGVRIGHAEHLKRLCVPLPGHETSTIPAWRKGKNNPLIGGPLGTCFDPCVQIDQGRYRNYFSWRDQAAIAVSESVDGRQWEAPQIVLSARLESGWEDHVNRASVVHVDGIYHLIYTGQSWRPGATGSWLGHAHSRDGIHWQRRDLPVLKPERTWEGCALMSPHILWNSERQIFQLWYCAGDQYEPDVIGYAESSDAVHWTRKQDAPVFTADRRQPWMAHKVGGPWVIRQDDWYWLFFIGFGDVDRARIGLARSRDGFSDWELHPHNPIIAPDPGSWDGDACYKPSVHIDAGICRLWYNGRNGPVEQIGLAECMGCPWSA